MILANNAQLHILTPSCTRDVLEKGARESDSPIYIVLSDLMSSNATKAAIAHATTTENLKPSSAQTTSPETSARAPRWSSCP